jgi:hypothetical protein
MYRVRAADASNTTFSAFSNNDMATAIIFTDDPLSPPNSVTIKAIHLTQLRDAVNAVRALANPVIFPLITNWTDPLPQGVTIKAQHMLELRTYMNPALTALGLQALSGDSSLATGQPIKGAHLQAVRDKVK